jgi:Icc-related predicted phosphoesterase
MKKNKNIKFLATGDFHSDLNLVNSIKEKVNMRGIDFILFTGDLSDKKKDFKKLLSIFENKPIFMVPGNHESKKQLDTLKKSYNIHLIGNSPVKINDKLAIFGTNYHFLGPYAIEHDEILKNMIENFKAIEDTRIKIQMAHIPPIDTKIGNASPFPIVTGCPSLKIFLENFNPDLTLVGHIHESSGLEEIVNKTKVINVGKTYKIFEFDERESKIKHIN